MKLYLSINDTKKSGVKTGEYDEVEMGNDNELYLTHTFDSLLNPVDYVSEMSFEVKLPRTKRNNILFDHFYSPDNFIVNESFDPNQKIPYYIVSDHNDIISRGNCFLNYIDEKYYHLSLLGGLNTVFTKYLNAGWDSNRRDEEDYYQIVDYLAYNGQNYSTPAKLNRQTVLGSWEIDPQKCIFDLDELQQKYNQLANRRFRLSNKDVYLANIVGFAIENQGKYPNFEAGKWYKQVGGIYKAMNVLRDDNNADPFALAEDGVTENQICEYRSYYQQPYIYIKRLLQIFQRESQAITGYQLKFDPTWYNNKDFFTNQLIYMLPSLFSDANAPITTVNQMEKGIRPIYLPPFRDYDKDTTEVAGLENIALQTDTASITSSEVFHIENGKSYNVHMKAKLQYDMSMVEPVMINRQKFNYDNPFHIHIYAKKRSDQSLITEKKIILIPTLEGEEDISNTIGDALFDTYQRMFNEVIEIKYDYATPELFTKTNRRWPINNNEVDLNLPITATEDADIDVYVKVSYLRKYTPFMGHNNNDVEVPVYWANPVRIEFNGATKIELNTRDNYRTNQPLTMERLFDGVKPFEIILKFCKLTGKIWLVDDYNKTVTIYDRENYFKTVLTKSLNSKVPPSPSDIDFKGVLDITNLVDKSKGYTITAPSWADHFLEFNFNQPEAEYFKQYKDKFDIGYGDKRIVTTNQKNSKTYKLFARNEYDTINASMISGEYIVKVKDIKNNNLALIQNYPQIVNFKEKEGAKVWNNFYFRNPNGRFDSGLGEEWRENYVLITDDLTSETQSDVYAWHSDDFMGVKAYNRPRFNTYSWQDEVSLQFANTREIYHQFPYLESTKYAYDLFFRNYIEQVYNFQSKKIEMYVAVNSMLYRRLKINPFIQIANSVFLVTQITDWSERRTSTKLTLIQIQNVDQLTGYTLPPIETTLLQFDDFNNIVFDNNKDRIFINNELN